MRPLYWPIQMFLHYRVWRMIKDPAEKKVIALSIGIAFAAGALSMLILINEPGPPEASLPHNIYGLPLSKIWAIIEDQTGVENATTVLGELRLVTADDGSVESLHMNFYGDDEGLHQWYRVAVSPMSVVTWDSLAVDTVPPGEHPFVLLSEIERIPYRELNAQDTGLIVEVDAQYGDLAYDARYGSLFALHRGEVVPLERVVFSTSEPWYDIAVFCRTGDGSTSEGSTSGGNIHCYTLFTFRDLGKAETVDYRNAESSLDA